jgi:Spy/CpxP family protein refolding chaperone
MKTLISIFLFGMILSQPALADMSDKDCQKGRLIEQLQLNDDQAGAVKQIMKEKREKRRAIMEDSRPQLEALRNETKEQLAAVLNDEQLLKFDEITEKRRNKREQRRSQYLND